MYQHSHYRGLRRRREREQGIENVFEEIVAEKFPNLKETNIQEQEAQRVPNKMNPSKLTPRHNIIKMAKGKERLLKAARKKESHTQGNPHKAIS